MTSNEQDEIMCLFFYFHCCIDRQVVWADTEEIGCAEQKCQAGTMVVCNYGPG